MRMCDFRLLTYNEEGLPWEPFFDYLVGKWVGCTCSPVDRRGPLATKKALKVMAFFLW